MDQIEKNFKEDSAHLDKDLVKKLKDQNKEALDEKKALHDLALSHKSVEAQKRKDHDDNAENGKVK